MNDNLEKELNEIESVEKQNQEHLKNIDSKMDELNELVNNINEKNVVTNKNVGNNNNVVINSNSTIQIQTQKEKTVMDLKKEIFDNRNFIRLVSFFSIFSIILIGLSFLSYYLYIVTNNMYFQWVVNHQNWFNAQNSNMQWRGYWCPEYLDNTILNCGWNFFRPLSFGVFIFACCALVISWIFNIILLTKFKDFKRIYLPFFIFSFIIPLLTWFYCMGLISFMKYRNKINYYEWLKQTKIEKIKNKYSNKII